MKRCLFMLACLGVAAFLGVKNPVGKDVVAMEPVQTVRIFTDGKEIHLQTDTHAKGSGKTLDAVLRSMHETSPSYVFLDTADFLIIDPELVALLPAMEELLRPSCRICLERGEPDMEKVGAFLNIHKSKITMKDFLAGERKIPVLETNWEGMQLVS